MNKTADQLFIKFHQHVQINTNNVYNVSNYDYLDVVGNQHQNYTGLPYLHDHWRTMQPLEPTLLLIIGIVMGVVGLTGVTGNVTVLLVLLRCKKLRTSANMYVFNLASADLLMCFGNFPFLILSCFHGKWITGYTSCQIYSFIGGLAGFVSINTLTCMAFERYNVIYRNKGLLRPTSSHHSTGLLISLWIYSLLWSVPPFFGWGYFTLDGGQVSCCFDYLTRNANNISYIIAMFVFCFGIQVMLMLFCYVSMVATICKHGRSLKRANLDVWRSSPQNSFIYCCGANSDDSTTPKNRCVRRRRVEMQVTRLVIFITVSFFFSWMPFAVVALIGAFGNISHLTPIVSTLPGMLAKVSTILNPLLYALGHPHCRDALLRKYCRLKRRRCDQTGASGRNAGQVVKGRFHKLSSLYFATILRRTEGIGMVLMMRTMEPSQDKVEDVVDIQR